MLSRMRPPIDRRAQCAPSTVQATVPDDALRHHGARHRRVPRGIVLATALLSAVVFALAAPIGGATASPGVHAPAAAAPASGCNPHGVAASEPSKALPPLGMRGYTRIYCDDFRGPALAHGWGKFHGQPSGDPGAMFLPSHVTQSGGLLSINTYRDAANSGNWATGGVCQCAYAQTYGAYFVRSQITGSGDDNDELLWPAQHVWPPEVDFNETGATTSQTASYVHYNSDNQQIGHQLSVDLTKWHTWGVIWTPSSITFTIDGRVWSRVTDPSAVPTIPMTLDLQEQTYCYNNWACPTQSLSMRVDWVTEFSPAH
jgi:hypothetical protein